MTHKWEIFQNLWVYDTLTGMYWNFAIRLRHRISTVEAVCIQCAYMYYYYICCERHNFIRTFRFCFDIERRLFPFCHWNFSIWQNFLPIRCVAAAIHYMEWTTTFNIFRQVFNIVRAPAFPSSVCIIMLRLVLHHRAQPRTTTSNGKVSLFVIQIIFTSFLPSTYFIRVPFDLFCEWRDSVVKSLCVWCLHLYFYIYLNNGNGTNNNAKQFSRETRRKREKEKPFQLRFRYIQFIRPPFTIYE